MGCSDHTARIGSHLHTLRSVTGYTVQLANSAVVSSVTGKFGHWRVARISSTECGLTLPSRGLARARRATLVLYSPLRAPCPREPLMSNVSPLVVLRQKSALRNSSSCSVSFFSAPASGRQLAGASSERSALFTLRRGGWLCRSSMQRLNSSFGAAASERLSPGTQCFRSSGISAATARHAIQPKPKSSVWARSAVLASRSVQVKPVRQFTERANPSIERTRKGKARYARSPFSASRALPSRASHVKR